MGKGKTVTSFAVRHRNFGKPSHLQTVVPDLHTCKMVAVTVTLHGQQRMYNLLICALHLCMWDRWWAVRHQCRDHVADQFALFSFASHIR